MHWTERRRAQTSIGEELRRRGWTLYGWKDDKSDAMTDTYDPATWDGVAQKDGYIAVVDVSKSNTFVLSRSGGHQTQQRVPAEGCPHCQGSGKEPKGWTFERAKANPVEFNRSWAKGGVALLQQVVSPLMFDGDGDQKCTQCHGVGHGWKLEPVTEPWPVFQHNPQNKNWHVEHGGRILASGVGLGPCADYDHKRARAGVEQLVDRIEQATCTPSPRPGNGNHNDHAAVTIRRNQARSGIEVVFSSKPETDVRSALKGLGFRWSQNQGLWWSRFSPRTWERVRDLLTHETSPPPEPQTKTQEPEPTMEVLDDPYGPKVPRYVIEQPLTGQVIGGSEPATSPEPEPWQISRLAFQESRALRVGGGVPILNAADGRAHEAAVRQGVEQGLPVPPHVLVEYGLTQADILEVVDVYGRRQRISRYDYLAGYEQIRLYCDSADTLLEDLPTWHAARQARGGAINFHRDNIARVVNNPSRGDSNATGDVGSASPLAPAIVALTAEPSPSVLRIDARFSYRECLRLKGEHPNTILLFRVGDFYEAFDEDAGTVAQACDLVLTTRLFDGKRVPLVGIPSRTVERHLDILRQAGYEVYLVHFEEAMSIPSLPAPEPAAAPLESPEPPSTTTWAVLTSLRWKNGRPTAPNGIIEARNGDGQIHHLTPWGDGLWCMSCNSDACHAAEAVLTTRPAASSGQAQTP